MATRSMAIRIRAVIGVSFCRCTNFPTRPYEEPMKLSYFSYDFWECCCVAPLVFRAPTCLDVGLAAPWAAARPGPCRHPPAPRPGPTTPLIPVPTPNFARNSPTTISNFEFRSLELQRFQPLLKLLPIELRASFLEATPCHHPPAPQPGPLESQPSHTPTPQASHPAKPSQRSFLCPHPISHVIPPQLFQTLNSDRWNCNVFGLH